MTTVYDLRKERIEAELKDVLITELDLDESALSDRRIRDEKVTEAEFKYLLEVPAVDQRLHLLVGSDPELLERIDVLAITLDDPDRAMHFVMERELQRVLDELLLEYAGRFDEA